MIVSKLLAAGLLIPILILVIPNVYASESNSKRYSDGYTNGGQRSGSNPGSSCDAHGQGDQSPGFCLGFKAGYDAEMVVMTLAH